MKRLALAVAAAAIFGCSSAPTPQGYYEQGIYIPTHVTECVNFCEDRGKVRHLMTDGATPDVVECLCRDGNVVKLSRDPFEG